MLARWIRCAALLLLCAAASAQAQQAPLKIVVGFSPGGGVDTLARLLAQQLADPLGRPVVVENRPGAGGTIAAEAARRAEPDGNTVLLADTSLIVAPYIYPTLPFRLERDFVPVAMVGEAGLALAVPSNHPARDLPEFIALARQAPGQYTYATVGVGSMHHLGGELFKRLSKTDLVHVPYKGGSPAVQALLGGQVTMAISSLPAVMPLASSGHIRILAVLSEDRFAGLPHVPTASQTLPGFETTPSLFLLAPAGTPRAALQRLESVLPQVLQRPALQQAFVAQGSQISYLSAPELAQWLPAQQQRWGDLIARSKLEFGQ
ncbi:hypothetical protein CEK29_21610 [Bordetella genomosp. 5]|uniref:Bug family tripartite tricarboxylate transporter substrate binding protein n=1 Tax=Bordetella genomosp. 5 TaxID=1395608 RepID=UPI000B9DEF5D|nr:tripartite tricarboxylate transporter substrate-binding protein [Bordetella genomosp. 5]OZI33450.1 hypothetical protein CEK29_21610 [Bordetella genomosp. 5]